MISYSTHKKETLYFVCRDMVFPYDEEKFFVQSPVYSRFFVDSISNQIRLPEYITSSSIESFISFLNMSYNEKNGGDDSISSNKKIIFSDRNITDLLFLSETFEIEELLKSCQDWIKMNLRVESAIKFYLDKKLTINKMVFYELLENNMGEMISLINGKTMPMNDVYSILKKNQKERTNNSLITIVENVLGKIDTKKEKEKEKEKMLFDSLKNIFSLIEFEKLSIPELKRLFDICPIESNEYKLIKIILKDRTELEKLTKQNIAMKDVMFKIGGENAISKDIIIGTFFNDKNNKEYFQYEVKFGKSRSLLLDNDNPLSILIELSKKENCFKNLKNNNQYQKFSRFIKSKKILNNEPLMESFVDSAFTIIQNKKEEMDQINQQILSNLYNLIHLLSKSQRKECRTKYLVLLGGFIENGYGCNKLLNVAIKKYEKSNCQKGKILKRLLKKETISDLLTELLKEGKNVRKEILEVMQITSCVDSFKKEFYEFQQQFKGYFDHTSNFWVYPDERKICFLGDFYTGKTIVFNYIQGLPPSPFRNFLPTRYDLKCDNGDLNIWHVPGNNDKSTFGELPLHSSKVIFFFAANNNKESLSSIKNYWINYAAEYSSDIIARYLIITYCNLPSELDETNIKEIENIFGSKAFRISNYNENEINKFINFLKSF